MTSEHTRLATQLKKLGGQGVADIIIFGSAVRGKRKPNDTDILVIFKDSVDKDVEYRIRKELEKHYGNVSIISKTEKTALDETFDARESILFEGRSLISGRPISARYGFSSFGMFKYDFSGWTNLQKTKFYYALNGRDGAKGIADALGIIKLSNSLVLVPLQRVEEFREFLDAWKITYRYIPTLLPERLGKKRLLE